MSSDNNKPIIKKAQELLKEFGHEVKTGHLYEVFSKLANEASWNVAKTKQVSFLDKILSPFKQSETKEILPWHQAKELYLESFQQNPKSTKFKLGMLLPTESNQEVKILEKNMTLEPNALFVGSMGTGKSVSMVATLVDYYLNNHDNVLIFIIDLLKGANDFQALFNQPKVFPILSSELGLHLVLTLIHDEALARRDKFKEVQAENILDYEHKTGKKLDRIVVAMEEFHSIPYYALNFDKDYKTPGTSAYRLHQLMRIGRSLGIWFIAASQKATKSYIPAELMPNFVNKQIFRVSKEESLYLLGSEEASQLQYWEKGKAWTDFGAVQFPYFTSQEQAEMIKGINPSGKFQNCLLTNQLIEDTLSQDPEKIYSLRKLSDYIKEIQYYDIKKVLLKLHTALGHKAKTMADSEVDLLLEIPQKGQVVVLTTDSPSGKHVIQLKQAMVNNKCPRGIMYCLAYDLPADLYKFAQENNIEVVDQEDLLRLALKIEEK